MSTDPVSIAVDKVKRRLADPELTEILERQELSVCYLLVDPVLRALGWDTDDPNLVQVQYNVTGDWSNGPNPDYALMNGRHKPILLIEAKYGGKGTKSRKLLDQAVEKTKEAIDKCGGRITSFVVTNGRIYERYEYSPGQQEKKLRAFDIQNDDINVCVSNLVEYVGRPILPDSEKEKGRPTGTP